ncbi:MAG TPA: long-chain fatty acid--CoA ligase, partial [Desulfobacteraceae bacterium]|nr:long-chain fatty acid--CoA ligase [Desulfobacteraceae bacterium]
MKETNLPALLLRNSKKYKNRKVALREKEFGIWQDVTWESYYMRVKEFALGLLSLGLGKGDKLAIIGDNRPEWIYSELAVQAIGGVPLGIYQDSIKTEVAY